MRNAALAEYNRWTALDLGAEISNPPTPFFTKAVRRNHENGPP